MAPALVDDEGFTVVTSKQPSAGTLRKQKQKNRKGKAHVEKTMEQKIAARSLSLQECGLLDGLKRTFT